MSKIHRFGKMLLVTMLLSVFLLAQIGLPQLGNLGGLLGGLGGDMRRRAPANVFKKILPHIDWALAADKVCPAGVWTVVGEYTVPAQQAYRFGFGSAAFPDNQGYIYIILYDDTATNSVIAPEGALRLVQRNSQGTINLVVAEFRTEQLKASVSDRHQMIALPEQAQFPMVGEDSVLEVQYKPDVAVTINELAEGTAAGLDIWNIPVTVYQ